MELNYNEFDEYQKEQIEEGLRKGLDVSVYANPKFDSDQMHILMQGLEQGIDVIPYVNPKFSFEQMCIIHNGLIDKQDVSLYADLKYNERQMRQIQKGIEKGLDVSIYADPKYNEYQMNVIRKGLAAGIDVSSYADSEIHENDMLEKYNELKPEIDFDALIVKATKADPPIDPEIHLDPEQLQNLMDKAIETKYELDDITDFGDNPLMNSFSYMHKTPENVNLFDICNKDRTDELYDIAYGTVYELFELADTKEEFMALMGVAGGYEHLLGDHLYGWGIPSDKNVINALKEMNQNGFSTVFIPVKESIYVQEPLENSDRALIDRNGITIFAEDYQYDGQENNSFYRDITYRIPVDISDYMAIFIDRERHMEQGQSMHDVTQEETLSNIKNIDTSENRDTNTEVEQSDIDSDIDDFDISDDR